MPLYVRDEYVNDLADRFAKMTGQNKTDAVRLALELAINAQADVKNLAQRVAGLQKRARALGIIADGQDDKVLMDDLSGGL